MRASIFPDYANALADWQYRNSIKPWEQSAYKDWFRRLSPAQRKFCHKGVAAYDAERQRGKEYTAPNPACILKPPTGPIADWIREFCPDVCLETTPQRPARSWHDSYGGVLVEPWHGGRFHQANWGRGSVEREALATIPGDSPVTLEYPGASFTFVNSVVAATLTPAIERIRAGKLLEKDLPKHVRQTRKAFDWSKPDANGYRQLSFSALGSIGHTLSEWNATTRSWTETQFTPASEQAKSRRSA